MEAKKIVRENHKKEKKFIWTNRSARVFLILSSIQSMLKEGALFLKPQFFMRKTIEFPSHKNLFPLSNIVETLHFTFCLPLLQLSTQFAVASFIVERENCLQLNYNVFVRHRETK